jgi:hypothetical protein
MVVEGVPIDVDGCQIRRSQRLCVGSIVMVMSATDVKLVQSACISDAPRQKAAKVGKL